MDFVLFVNEEKVSLRCLVVDFVYRDDSICSDSK